MSVFKCRWSGLFRTIQLRRLTFLISISRNTSHESSTRFCIRVAERIWRSIWGNVWTWSLRVRNLVFSDIRALFCQGWRLIFLGGSSWRVWARFHNICPLSCKTIACFYPLFALFTLHSFLSLFLFCGSFFCQNFCDPPPVSRDYNLTICVQIYLHFVKVRKECVQLLFVVDRHDVSSYHIALYQSGKSQRGILLLSGLNLRQSLLMKPLFEVSLNLESSKMAHPFY